MSDNTNSAHGFTEGSEFNTETKEMEGELKPTDAGYKWFTCPTCDGTAKISQDQLEQINKDHLRSELQKAKEKEIRGDRMIVDLEHQKCVLKSDLSKAKELNGELVNALKLASTIMSLIVPSSNNSKRYVEWIESRDKIESLIKKSNP